METRPHNSPVLTEATDQDRARDLLADLALCEAADRRNLNCLSASRDGWPAAIRRALTAEEDAFATRWRSAQRYAALRAILDLTARERGPAAAVLEEIARLAEEAIRPK